MKMKLREVNKNLSILARMGGKTFPAKMSFAISRNFELLQRESERIEKERKRLCENYSEKDEEGNAVMIDSVIDGQPTKEYKMTEEKRSAFEVEYNELMDEEIEVDIRKVKQEVIERCEEAERYDIPTVADIVGMSFMIEE